MSDLTLEQIDSLDAMLHPADPCQLQYTASTTEEHHASATLLKLCEYSTGLIAMSRECLALRAEVERLTKERNDARGNARVLAHAYEHDTRPPANIVERSLAYPVDARSEKGRER